MARTSTYLNFSNRTAEAFDFYKAVFKTEFIGNGMTRFGDAPGNPPTRLSAEQKDLVLHIELPIIGGHILMASDAPESMGFKISFGNNVHINLEPDTRQETKRLYDELSKDGKAVMPLAEMFWGAYFGTCTDRFGVNWMFNCAEPQK
jgi:PhnB protein